VSEIHYDLSKFESIDVSDVIDEFAFGIQYDLGPFDVLDNPYIRVRLGHEKRFNSLSQDYS
jgi:hypothetical protein